MRIIFIFPLLLIFGCNQKSEKKEAVEIHLSCESDSQVRIETQIDISNDILKIEHPFLEKLEYAKYQVNASEIIINWKDGDIHFKDGRYQIRTMNINRYTGRYKEKLVNYFPNSSEEKESDPHYTNGSCQSFNEKKF